MLKPLSQKPAQSGYFRVIPSISDRKEYATPIRTMHNPGLSPFPILHSPFSIHYSPPPATPIKLNEGSNEG
jgi:hypothetical protein